MNFITYRDRQNVNLDTVSSITCKETMDVFKIVFSIGGLPIPVSWTLPRKTEGG